MFRKLLLALGLAALVIQPLHAQPAADVAKTINDLEDKWGAALLEGNWAAVEALMTPDFVATFGNGSRQDAAAYMAAAKARKASGTTISNFKPDPYTVLVNGTTAVHLGGGTFTLTPKNGKARRIHTVHTDTWVRTPDGKWLCLAGQSVDLPVK